MAIEVELPDGTIAEFPDGTPPETIKAALSRKFGSPTPAKPAQNVPGFAQEAMKLIGASPVAAGIAMAPAVTQAAIGDAAEELPSAVGSEGFRSARTAAAKERGYLDNLGRESQETMAAVFGNDDDLARELAGNVPGAKITKDANGNAVIELPSGERVYPNQPGLDAQDVVRFAGNAASYLPAVRLARTVAGGSALGRAGVTGVASAGTNVGGQVAAGREDIDLKEAATVGGFGAAGELAAPVIGKVIQAIGRSPQKGQARAYEILRRDLGIEQPTNKQVQTFANALDEIDAGADPAAILGADEFGFIYTKGQRLRDGNPSKFETLTDEELLRQDPGFAGNTMRSVEQQNRSTLEEVVGRLARPDEAAPRSPVEAFEQIGERTRSMADELRPKVNAAYDRVREINRASVSADAVREIPQRIRRALSEFDINDSTPGTRDAVASLRAKVEGLRPDAKGVTLREIESQRRILSNAVGTAANNTDRAALRRLKAEFDSWMDESFENALISGDEEALSAIKTARELRTEFGRRFEGKEDVDKLIVGMVEDGRTAEEMLNMALGASQVSKASAARFIERIRTATGGDPQTMGAMKAAHLMRLFQGKNGETLGVQAIRNNILAAERETPSVIRSLYGDTEWGQVRRLAQSLGPMVERGTFARRPGTADQALRQLMSLPFIGRAIEAVRQPVTIGRAFNATKPLAPEPAPRLVPAAAAGEGGRR